MLPLIVLIPFAGALLPWLLSRRSSIHAAHWAAIPTLAALVAVLTQAPAVMRGDTLIESWPWIAQVGLNASFRLDGFSLLFALLILGIGLLVILYAHYYLSARDPLDRFFGYLLFFMAAMLGMVLSENLLLLVVFWELTSLASFLLIGFWGHEQQARQGARLSLLVTGFGGLALLAGVLLLGDVAGSFELSVVLAAGSHIKAHPHYPLILGLVLTGAFTKSAQFPFHFWLPQAMAAPTPVSAYLHSATMVKAGIFLLGRLFPALAGTDLWFFTVSTTGLTTLLLASFIAMYRHDLKGLLAYSTASHLGLITLLFGIGTPLGAIAAVFHIINHAVFKASLFMAAGIVDHETGTRDMRRLSGLARYMPQTAILATIAAGAMAGVPLLNGFLSKEMFFAETLEIGRLGAYSWLTPLAATLAGVFTVAYSARFVHDVFFGPPPVLLDRTPHEPPRWMKLPLAILVVLCLLVGFAPQLTVRALLDAGASSVLQQALPFYEVKLWHGFNLPLLMSAVALIGGACVYLVRRYQFDLHSYQPSEYTGKALAERIVDTLLRGMRRLLARVENGSLQRYMRLLLLATIAVSCVGLSSVQLSATHSPLAADPFAVLAATILIVAAVLAAAQHRQRVRSIVSLGVVGLVVSLIFVRFSAPDLALTQLLVEIVTIILLLLAMFFLPQESPRESAPSRRWTDIAIAASAGATVALLSWLAMAEPASTLAKFFIENAKPRGGGHNVVNVILVDFRGLDTLGEITVLAIAAIGIAGMLGRLRFPAREVDWLGRAWSADRHPIMLGVIARVILPLGLLVAVYLFLRGHNAPGGGFIAGLVVAAVIILQYIANGSEATRALLPVDATRLLGLGLLIALLTGLGSWIFDAPFLTSTYSYVSWPVVGRFEIASALAFDLGVLLVVVGAVLSILANLGHASAGNPLAGEHAEPNAASRSEAR